MEVEVSDTIVDSIKGKKVVLYPKNDRHRKMYIYLFLLNDNAYQLMATPLKVDEKATVEIERFLKSVDFKPVTIKDGDFSAKSIGKMAKYFFAAILSIIILIVAIVFLKKKFIDKNN